MPEEFGHWMKHTINQLLPQYRFEPPSNLTYLHRIYHGGWLDECVIGLGQNGYWGLWMVSTA